MYCSGQCFAIVRKTLAGQTGISSFSVKGTLFLGYFAVLHAYGYFDRKKLSSFQTNGSDLIAHPVKKYDLGIESSNGSLGQGLSFGLGMAMGMTKREKNRRVYVLLGDGECNEGSVWETAALAGERGVSNLVAVIDENGFRNDGENSMYTRGPVIADVWRAFNWNVIEIDGHDVVAIQGAFDAAQRAETATAIVAKTIKGRGVSFMEANNDWHHNRITPKTLDEILAEFDA